MSPNSCFGAWRRLEVSAIEGVHKMYRGLETKISQKHVSVCFPSGQQLLHLWRVDIHDSLCWIEGHEHVARGSRRETRG